MTIRMYFELQLAALFIAVAECSCQRTTQKSNYSSLSSAMTKFRLLLVWSDHVATSRVGRVREHSACAADLLFLRAAFASIAAVRVHVFATWCVSSARQLDVAAFTPAC